MTIKEKAERLQQAFNRAWDQYAEAEQRHSKQSGKSELLTVPELKTAYQQWQRAVGEYYDFIKTVQTRDLNEELTNP